MTHKERMELMKRCYACPHRTTMTFKYDAEHRAITMPYSTERAYGTGAFPVCKLLALICGEIEQPCPADSMTEEEIEAREEEFDNMDI